MFGYACRDTEQMMPLTWTMATDALLELDEIRQTHMSQELLMDAKSQVTYNYDDQCIDTFLIST